jgi:hypothetical protein
MGLDRNALPPARSPAGIQRSMIFSPLGVVVNVRANPSSIKNTLSARCPSLAITERARNRCGVASPKIAARSPGVNPSRNPGASSFTRAAMSQVAVARLEPDSVFISARPSLSMSCQRIKSGKRDQTARTAPMLPLCVSGYQVYAENYFFVLDTCCRCSSVFDEKSFDARLGCLQGDPWERLWRSADLRIPIGAL